MSADFTRQLYVESSFEIDVHPGKKFAGGTFDVQTMMAYANRGFVEMMYFRMDGQKEDLEGRYLYELGHFDVNDFKEESGKMKLARGQNQALQENYLKGLQEAGLQEDRLIKLEDGVPFEAKIAELLKVAPPAQTIPTKPEISKPSFDGTTVNLGPLNLKR